jgi:hypothetical protein
MCGLNFQSHRYSSQAHNAESKPPDPAASPLLHQDSEGAISRKARRRDGELRVPANQPEFAIPIRSEHGGATWTLPSNQDHAQAERRTMGDLWRLILEIRLFS